MKPLWLTALVFAALSLRADDAVTVTNSTHKIFDVIFYRTNSDGFVYRERTGSGVGMIWYTQLPTNELVRLGVPPEVALASAEKEARQKAAWAGYNAKLRAEQQKEIEFWKKRAQEAAQAKAKAAAAAAAASPTPPKGSGSSKRNKQAQPQP